jgi:CRISPR/Cas system-associated exonuclease Cas4 (RecB family)
MRGGGLDPDTVEDSVEPLIDRVSGSRFSEWYREREFTQNVRQGTPYFNGPRPTPPPTRHSPSTLLQCHRKIAYRQLNAPAEQPDPEGIFWVGIRFEEDIALPFLQEAVTGPDTYACNSLWVDFTAETDTGDLHIKGETDPVIVDSDGEPLLLTEIKTKRSVDNVDAPNRHHRAQAHAYMRGLSEKYDRPVTNAVILYGGRTSLDVRCFHIEFDPAFWTEIVLEWAERHTSYRLNDELPPAEPTFDWECTFCSYRQRCGRGDGAHSDIDPVGLLPRRTDYPQEKLVEYLDAYPEAKLTPELAQAYPTLADSHGAYDWVCEACGVQRQWDDMAWNGMPSDPPDCPECVKNGVPASLSGPPPAIQQERMEEAIDA